MKLKKLGLLLACAALCAGFAFALTGCKQEAEPVHEDTNLEADDAAEGDNEPFYVLVIGNDSRTGTVESNIEYYADGSGRSDTIMLLRVDPTTYQVGIVTIPRDTQCTYNDATAKINETYHQGGVEDLKTAIKELTGVQVKYYFDMGFVDYANFIDSINGVDVNVPIDMSLKDIISGNKIELSAGEQTLDGSQALVVSRQRKQYASLGDVQRQRLSRNIVQSVITRVANDPDNKDMYLTALYAVADSDFPKENLSQLIDSFAENAGSLSFVSGTGPYDGDFDDASGEWYAVRDEATWKRVIAALEAHTDPQAIVAIPEAIAAE